MGRLIPAGTGFSFHKMKNQQIELDKLATIDSANVDTVDVVQ